MKASVIMNEKGELTGFEMPELQVSLNEESSKRLDAIPGRLDELYTIINGKLVKEEIVDPKKTVALHEDALLEESGIAGMFSKVSNIEILNIPIGQAAIGGFGAVFASELIDGFMSTQSPTTRGLVKLAGAGAVVMFGKKLIGSGTAKVIALLLTFDAVRDLTPIDEWATKLSTMVTKVVPTAGLGTTNPPKNPKDIIALQQAQQILSSTQRASMRG